MLTVMMLTALLLKMTKYKKKEEGGRQDDKENTAHLCRLAMRADVKEWGCHFRPRDLIHRSEVNNKAEHDDQEGEEKVVVMMMMMMMRLGQNSFAQPPFWQPSDLDMVSHDTRLLCFDLSLILSVVLDHQDFLRFKITAC